MASTVRNFITTSILTLLTGTLLFFIYRTAVRPILVRHNIIPLQQLPETIRRAMTRDEGRVRLHSGEYDEDARVRVLEEAYRDEEDDVEGGERALRRQGMDVVEGSESEGDDGVLKGKPMEGVQRRGSWEQEGEDMV